MDEQINKVYEFLQSAGTFYLADATASFFKIMEPVETITF
jgi:hypothetical protein